MNKTQQKYHLQRNIMNKTQQKYHLLTKKYYE